MGQLEKYGLYVLCLVIFLILGVTIWGGGEAAPVRVTAQPIRADVQAAAASPSNLAAMAEDIFRQPAPEPVRATPAPAVADATPPAAAPAAAPAAESPTAPAVPAVYKVQKGDTFATIARTKLGKEAMWPEIQRLNPDVQPSKLREGQELKLPVAGATAAAAKPATKPALDKPLPMPADGTRDYVVRKGDTFERIALNQLGGRKRTAELMAANPNVPPEKLRAGMTIKLPKK